MDKLPNDTPRRDDIYYILKDKINELIDEVDLLKERQKERE